ncbi:hypothetical protein V6N13_084296 [Hibiscus sabdariffa]
MWQAVLSQSQLRLRGQSHLIEGTPNSKSSLLRATPLHGSPLMFHESVARIRHCWKMEFNALTIPPFIQTRTHQKRKRGEESTFRRIGGGVPGINGLAAPRENNPEEEEIEQAFGNRRVWLHHRVFSTRLVQDNE